MAELERASLRSEHISDISSSPVRPDDLVLDDQNVLQVSFSAERQHNLSELTEKIPTEVCISYIKNTEKHYFFLFLNCVEN